LGQMSMPTCFHEMRSPSCGPSPPAPCPTDQPPAPPPNGCEGLRAAGTLFPVAGFVGYRKRQIWEMERKRREVPPPATAGGGGGGKPQNPRLPQSCCPRRLRIILGCPLLPAPLELGLGWGRCHLLGRCPPPPFWSTCPPFLTQTKSPCDSSPPLRPASPCHTAAAPTTRHPQ